MTLRILLSVLFVACAAMVVVSIIDGTLGLTVLPIIIAVAAGRWLAHRRNGRKTINGLDGS